MRKVIPYGHHSLNKSDIAAVADTLRSEFITQGPMVEKFEDAFRKKVGARFAVAVSSGTAALHLASLVLGLKEDDEIITTPISFVATANAALYCGARPVFVDVEKDTINIDPSKIEKAITAKTKAIYPVHFGGLPAQVERISHLARKHNLVVVEDAAHALGARYNGTPVGNCRFSEMTIFSFHPVKHITTGEGGMITTDNRKLYEKLLTLRSHGIFKSREHFSRKKEGDWYYEMHGLGFNYRLTDFQSALGLSQLAKLDSFVAARRKIAQYYKEVFSVLPHLELPFETKNSTSSYHLFVIRLKEGFFRVDRKKIFEFLREKGLLVQVHYIPIYWQPFYQSLGYKMGICPIAEDYYRRAISLPIFPDMTAKEIKKVITTVKQAVEKFGA